VVIVSGGQGARETEDFRREISDATRIDKFKAAVERRLEKTNGAPVAFVSKEDVGSSFDSLLLAIDGMLFAREQHVANFDSVVRATKREDEARTKTPVRTTREVVAEIADTFQAMVGTQQTFFDRLRALSEKHGASRDSLGKPLTRAEQIFTDPHEGSFDTLMSKPPRQVRRDLHNLFSAMAGMQMNVEAIGQKMPAEASSDYGELSDWWNEKFYGEDGFHGVCRKLHDEYKSHVMPQSVVPAKLVETIAADIGASVLISEGEGVSMIALPAPESTALEQAIVNASQAQEFHGQVGIAIRKSDVSELPTQLRTHFEGLGHSDVVSVEITNTGESFPDEVLARLRFGESVAVPSTRHDGNGIGMELMADAAREANNGVFTAENIPNGAKVTLYFGARSFD